MLFFDGYGNTFHVAIILGGLPVNKSKAFLSGLCYTAVLVQVHDSGLTADWEVGTFCT